MFNNLTCLLIKSITETLKCLNFLILFSAMITLSYPGEKNFRFIAVSGVILYLFFTATITLINKNNKRKNIKIVVGIIINLIIAFAIITSLDWFYKPFCGVYFLGIIFFATTHYSNEIEDPKGFITKYTYSTVVLITLIVILQGTKYIEVVKIYFPLYVIMSILYIVQVNILEEYNHGSVNLINENRNIRRFNLTSIFIAAISILVFTTNFFNKIYDFSNYLLEEFIYILIKPASIVMTWWYKYSLKGTAEKSKKMIEELMKKGKEEAEKIKEEQVIENNVVPSETAMKVIKILLIIIFIVIVSIVVYSIYIKIKAIKINNIKLDVLDGEERTFVFKKDKSEKIKKNKTLGNLRDLHVIRKIYIDVIKILKGKGVEYKSSYTPNEYNSFIENTEFKSKNINQLVDIYNNLRYGNKNISKEDISKAYKIKEDL